MARNELPLSSRKYSTEQRKEQLSVVDLFKSPSESRAKVDYKHDFTNGNVYAKNFTPAKYKNTVNDFSTLVADNNDEMKEIRMIDPSNKRHVESFNKTLCNRLQRFEFKNKPHNYSEITRIEKISGEGYSQLKDNLGLNNFYAIKKNNMYGIEYTLMILAFKK